LQTGRAATCIDVEAGISPAEFQIRNSNSLVFVFVFSRVEIRSQPKKRGRPRASDLSSVGVTTSMMQELSTDSTNGPNNESEDLVIIMSTSLRCARLTSSLVQTLGLVSDFRPEEQDFLLALALRSSR
jgi:hypothetical protein